MAPLYFPLREKVEGWTIDLAKNAPQEDVISPSLKQPGAAEALLAKPGIYLRLAQPNATTVPKIRAAAMDSLRDAFTACFLRAKNPDPRDGKECRSTKECDKGKICNEVNHCTVLSQPANLRVAYRGMRVLEDTWIREVQTATDALRLRLFEGDLDSAVAADIPSAIDLMVRGQYFLVVLDEIPDGTKPEDKATLEETVQAIVHPTRVGLYDVKTGELLFKGRREIDVTVPVVPGSVDAQRRQVLNCALARDVRRTLGATELASVAAVFGEVRPPREGQERTGNALDRMQIALRRRLPRARGERAGPATLCGDAVGHHGPWRVVVEGVLRAGESRAIPSLDEIARSFAEHGGVFAIRALRGAFALAAWNEQTEQLWLARDPTGQRVLYHARLTSGPGLAFASETKALLARGDVSRDIDRLALVRYLVFSFVPGEPTLLEAVREVPPGTAIVFDGLGAETQRTTLYTPLEPADIEARDAEARARPETVQRYATELRATLEHVLRDELAATADRGAPAAFLSGGVDSSLVVALAAALGHKPVCYSISFGADVPNELEWSGLVASHIGAEHRVIEVTPAAMTEALPETVYLLDDPIGDPLTVPNHVLAATAQREGFRRVLNGEGGDPCFGGPKNIPMILAEWYDPHEGARERAYLRSYQKLYDDLPRLLDPGLYGELTTAEPLWAPIAPYLGDDGQKSFLNKLQTINLVFKGGNSILVKVEKLAGAHGLVALSLLFEREVADRAWEAPPSFKLAGNIEKLVLKAAVTDLLPAAIIDRKKSGMLVPVHPWFQGELKGYAAQAFEPATITKRGLFRREAVDEMRKYRGATTTRGFYGAKLWLLLTLEIWMRLYVDGDASFFESAEPAWDLRPT